MATRNLSYDHPAYLARQSHVFPALAAGASGATSKFVAFTSLSVFAVAATQVTAAASTSTATLWNGTATVTGIYADSFSVIRIMNNAAAGATPSLTTATYGPFAVSLYNGTSTGTQTNNTAGFTNYYQLYGPNVNASGTATNTTGQIQAGAPAGNGGMQVNQGDQVYIQRGTDASSILGLALEYSITPLSNISN